MVGKNVSLHLLSAPIDHWSSFLQRGALPSPTFWCLARLYHLGWQAGCVAGKKQQPETAMICNEDFGLQEVQLWCFYFYLFFCLFPSKGEGLSTSFMTIAIFGSYSSPPYVGTILPTTPQGGYYKSCFKDQKLNLDKESFLRSGNWKVLQLRLERGSAD